MAETRMLSTWNFIVPADTLPSAYLVRDNLTAGVPLHIDFRLLNLDGAQFFPYSVFMDNRYGTQPLWVTIDQIGLNIGCQPGADKIRSYPGIADQSVTVTGEGAFTLIFANFPVTAG